GFRLEQAQDFTPTPMTVATKIYYSGPHPYTLQPVETPKTKEDKITQNNYFFWYKPEFRNWIRTRLTKLNRPDLVKQLLGDDKPMPANTWRKKGKEALAKEQGSNRQDQKKTKPKGPRKYPPKNR
ncbi:MAG TPA: DUF3362 domain-containing protein, partial [Saprospiraceae bacterium]|nr:DUF3362 domain-containing protein [Saprospiraceae bacterium]